MASNSSEATNKEILSYLVENSKDIGELKGTIGGMAADMKEMAASVKVLNHNSTDMATRIAKIEQKQSDGAALKKLGWKIAGLIAAVVGATAAVLQLLH